MSKTERLNPNQEEMLAVSNSGLAIPRDLEAQDMSAVPLNERYIHLSNVLKMFDRVVQLDYIARQNPIPKNVSDDYKLSKQQAMSRNSAKAAEQLRGESRAEFYKAYGVVALASGDSPASSEEIEREASKEYDRFTMRYAGPHKRERRKEKREFWESLLKQRTETDSFTPDTPILLDNEDHNEEQKQPGLSTREKLIILAEADDAGFLPTTNEEKNMAMTYLDYIKNQAYELGTQSQLVEVGNFHGKHHSFFAAKEYALQSGRSIAFEFADWFSQSSQQLTDLKEVKQLIDEIDNPNLSLAIALNADMKKAIPLIRFMDLSELRAKGKVEYKTEKGVIAPPFDLLRTRRNEDVGGLVPGKNKVLEDPYTGARTKVATEWLKTRMAQIKVRDVRKLIQEAISDQENRAEFHKLVLKDLALHKTDSEMLKEASKVAQSILLKAS